MGNVKLSIIEGICESADKSFNNHRKPAEFRLKTMNSRKKELMPYLKDSSPEVKKAAEKALKVVGSYARELEPLKRKRVFAKKRVSLKKKLRVH